MSVAVAVVVPPVRPAVVVRAVRQGRYARVARPAVAAVAVAVAALPEGQRAIEPTIVLLSSNPCLRQPEAVRASTHKLAEASSKLRHRGNCLGSRRLATRY